MAFTTIQLELEPPGCARIVLNRPDRKNAFNDTMLRELSACVDMLNDDASVKVVGVMGAGGTFSAGRDLSELGTVGRRDSFRPVPRAGGHESSMFQRLEMPTVALLDGATVGGSIGFALQCDIRVATERAIFLDGHLPNGMVPSVSTWYAARIMTPGQALRFFARKKPLDAREALAIGLVDLVVGVDELEPSFAAIADDFLPHDARLLRHTKAIVRQAVTAPFDTSMLSVGLFRAVERRDKAAAEDPGATHPTER